MNVFPVRLGWTVLAAPVLLVMLAGLPEPFQAWLALDRAAVRSGEAWRLWTGHLVHYGVNHAFVNALAAAGLFIVVRPERGVWLGAAVCLPLLGGAILWLEPGLAYYRGASGAVVWLGVQAWCRVWRGCPTQRGGLLVLATALVAKLIWESWPGAGAVTSASLPEGVGLAWSAHLAGAVLGLAWAGVCAGCKAQRGERLKRAPRR